MSVASARNEGRESEGHESRLAVLDGWRGISILLVMATHLLPLGPKSLAVNDMFGPMGMALFFTLSGFLITRFLLRDAGIVDFLVRRFTRIVPLAWLAMTVVLLMESAPLETWLANLFFYANLPPQHLTEVGSHLWSLCVEMQFYVGIALVVAVFGSRGLYAVPLLCLAVTLHRVSAGALVDIVTWRRVDEILAGSVLALIFERRLGERAERFVARGHPYVLLVLLAVCSHPAGGFMNYLRPYVAALLVGSTLYTPPQALVRLLTTRTLAYIATVSYALYVIHHVLMFTWLGSGEKLVRYLKRPLLFAATFALAHVSTFHFERHCIHWGKQFAGRLKARRVAAAAADGGA